MQKLLYRRLPVLNGKYSDTWFVDRNCTGSVYYKIIIFHDINHGRLATVNKAKLAGLVWFGL